MMPSDWGLGDEQPGTALCGQDVVEFPLLLTTSQAEALYRASQNRGVTAGQLARRAIAEFLSHTPATRGGHRTYPR